MTNNPMLYLYVHLLLAECATVMQEMINSRNMSSEIFRILGLVHIRTVHKLMAQAVRL